MKFATVAGIAIVIAAIDFVTGKFTAMTGLGLLALLIIGAIFPPLGVGLGILAITYILFTRGQALFSWINGKFTGGKKP